MNHELPMLGFTLIELLVVVLLIGILAVFGTQMILGPVESFTHTSRRAELVDVGDNALQRISRELRNALPNSVRISIAGTRTALEFLHTSTGGRYRAREEMGGGGEVLQNCQNDIFDVLDGISGVINAGPAGQANCMNGTADCLVIYNTGVGPGYFDAYNGDNIAAITAVNGGANRLTCDNGVGWSFPFPIPPSSQQRFFIVDMPVSFVCDIGSNELLRYSDYGISAVQPVSAAAFGIAGNALADHIIGCQFDYNAGAGTRHGLITLRVQIQEATSGESVALLHQVHVVNVP